MSKIVVYTHLFDRDQAIRALWLGVHDVLTKPVDFNMLKWLIQRASVLRGLELDGRPMPAETVEGMGE